MKSVKFIDENKIEGLHNRLFGYVGERLSSCMFFILMNEKHKKFLQLPIVILPKEELKKSISIESEKIEEISIPRYSVLTFIMG